jgi:hypothetical protein
MNDTLKPPESGRLIAADKVQGTQVFDRSGQKLGTIKDIYLEKVSGQAEFASLAFGGVLGVGAKYHPIPWSILDYDTSMHGFVVDLDKDVLKGSPSYEDERLEDPNVGWGGEVTTYYGDFLPDGLRQTP